MSISNHLLESIPLAFPLYYLAILVDSPIDVVKRWFYLMREPSDSMTGPPVGSQLLAYVVVGVLGFIATDKLIPKIKVKIIVEMYFLVFHPFCSLIKFLRHSSAAIHSTKSNLREGSWKTRYSTRRKTYTGSFGDCSRDYFPCLLDVLYCRICCQSPNQAAWSKLGFTIRVFHAFPWFHRRCFGVAMAI